MSAVERTLARWARWPIILALALASLLLMVALGHVGRQPGVPAATALDLRLGYTQAEAAAALAPLTPAQRDLAARAHLTLDVVYPLAYGALFALLLVRLWPRRASGCWPPPPCWPTWAKTPCWRPCTGATRPAWA